MIVWTDSPLFADSLLKTRAIWKAETEQQPVSPIPGVAERLIQSGALYSADSQSAQFWTHSYLVENAKESQLDLLAEILEENPEVPDGILCCAGSGDGFHGHQNRPWVALPGNVHLTALFRPNLELANCGIGFTVVAVVTVLQVIESMSIAGAKVKWVNDILLSGAKACGVLVHVKTQGEKVTAALVGIGLNVERVPSVKPDLFVPEVTALKHFAADPSQCTQGRVFRMLAAQLAANYNRYLTGHLSEFLDFYTKRSIVIGKMVTIYDETDPSKKVVSGRVSSIGTNLELNLEGKGSPVWRGRLALAGDNHL